MISFSHLWTYFSHSFSDLGQDVQLLISINRLTSRYPFKHDYASDVDEHGYHLLHIRQVHSCYFSYSRSHVFKCIDFLFDSVGVLVHFTKIRLMHCSTFILVRNKAEQHNTVTLEGYSEANQLMERGDCSRFRLDEVQGRLPFTLSPLLKSGL